MNKLLTALFCVVLCGCSSPRQCSHLFQGHGEPVNDPVMESYQYIDTITGVRYFWNFRTESWE